MNGFYGEIIVSCLAGGESSDAPSLKGLCIGTAPGYSKFPRTRDKEGKFGEKIREEGHFS